MSDIPLLGDRFRELEKKFDKLLENSGDLTPTIREQIGELADDVLAILEFYDILNLPNTDPRKIAILTDPPKKKKEKKNA